MGRRFLEPALRNAGLPAMRFHDLRHTYAWLLIAQGVHPKLVQEQLGSASMQITLDRYGHLMDQSVVAGSALQTALFGGRTASVSPPSSVHLTLPRADEGMGGVLHVS